MKKADKIFYFLAFAVGFWLIFTGVSNAIYPKPLTSEKLVSIKNSESPCVISHLITKLTDNNASDNDKYIYIQDLRNARKACKEQLKKLSHADILVNEVKGETL